MHVRYYDPTQSTHASRLNEVSSDFTLCIHLNSVPYSGAIKPYQSLRLDYIRFSTLSFAIISLKILLHGSSFAVITVVTLMDSSDDG